MKIKRFIILAGLALFFIAQCFAQTIEEEKEAIVKLIEECYVGAAHNNIDIDVLKKGFHESFAWQNMHHGRLFTTTLKQWIILLNRQEWLRPDWNNRTTAEIEVIGLEGNAAVAKVKIYNNKVQDYTDFLSVLKFTEGWKITNRISKRHEIPPEVEYERHLEWEKSIAEKLQPPEKVMDAIGVKPGMTIGEIGAGRGRYTVHLAGRVGPKGKIFANDIDENALSILRQRCQQENIVNIETILGKENDPLFPKKSLDMAFMVWVFHGLDNPGPLFKNLKPGLKPGAPLVIVDPIDSEIDLEREFAGEKIDPNSPTIKERVEKAAEEAGFEIVRIETFLPKDYIFILKVKTGR
ncbi:MAG: methyltransferase domain-containing protein [Candidatus Aminicenantes bacterium]|nr:methyltransferase domain-containing protein [Candidatus Aminicenantes bacterium]